MARPCATALAGAESISPGDRVHPDAIALALRSELLAKVWGTTFDPGSNLTMLCPAAKPEVAAHKLRAVLMSKTVSHIRRRIRINAHLNNFSCKALRIERKIL